VHEGLRLCAQTHQRPKVVLEGVEQPDVVHGLEQEGVDGDVCVWERDDGLGRPTGKGWRNLILAAIGRVMVGCRNWARVPVVGSGTDTRFSAKRGKAAARVHQHKRATHLVRRPHRLLDFAASAGSSSGCICMSFRTYAIACPIGHGDKSLLLMMYFVIRTVRYADVSSLLSRSWALQEEKGSRCFTNAT
jgi:hypothetical protein